MTIMAAEEFKARDAANDVRARVAVDARMLRDAGIGTHVRNVVPRLAALRPHWEITVLGNVEHMRAEGWGRVPNLRLERCAARIYSLAEQAALVRASPRNLDVFWSPHYNVPVFIGAPLVVTVHDVAHLALPETAPGLARKVYARTMFSLIRRKAAAVLCLSDFTRREYLRLVGRGRSEPRVVHGGVAAEWHRAGERAPTDSAERPYVIFVGSVKPHKNLAVLVDAFIAVMDEVPHDLVVVGRLDGMRIVDDAALARAAHAGNRLRILGEVSNERLRELVGGADALVMPSSYEGFGLPPLEAMAAGTPCIVSRAASLPEVCGDAAIYCEPGDAADLARALGRLLGDGALREDLRSKGRAHAAEFTWQRTAELTARALDEAMAARAAGHAHG